MAAFHIDQNAPRRIAERLRQRGHQARTASDLGMATAPDAAHLLGAWQDRYILVSRDRDYRERHYARLHWPPAWQVPVPRPHAGILLILSDWSIAQAVHELELFVQSGQPLDNRLY